MSGDESAFWRRIAAVWFGSGLSIVLSITAIATGRAVLAIAALALAIPCTLLAGFLLAAKTAALRKRTPATPPEGASL